MKETADYHAAGQPFTPEFERHVRNLLARKGVSAANCREQMIVNADFMLKGAARDAFVVPEQDWFNKQREAVGLMSRAQGSIGPSSLTSATVSSSTALMKQKWGESPL